MTKKTVTAKALKRVVAWQIPPTLHGVSQRTKNIWHRLAKQYFIHLSDRDK